MATQDASVVITHELIQAGPGGKTLQPTGAAVGPFTGDAPTNFATESPRTLTDQNMKRLGDFPVQLAFMVPNRLGGDAKELGIEVKFDRPTDEWLAQVIEQTPPLARLQKSLQGLYELKAILPTRRGQELARRLVQLLAAPDQLALAAAELAESLVAAAKAS